MSLRDTHLSATQWLQEQTTIEVFSTTPATTDIVAAGTMGIPDAGFDMAGRNGKGLFITTTGACTVRIQGRPHSSAVFYTLKKITQLADGSSTVTLDEVYTLVANESAWIPVDASCKHLRAFITNTTSPGATITVKVEACGGR